MKRRQYLTRIGSGASIVALTGCAAPGGGTETQVGTEAGAGAGGGQTTTGGGGTEATTTGGEGGGQTTNQTAANQTTGTAGGQQVPNTISMVTEGSNYYFNPVGLFVEPGETITWVNESGSHSSTAYTMENPQSEVRRIPDDAAGWNSGIISEQGAEFTHTFDVQGTYDYYCIPHKTLGMVARIVVGEPSGIEGDPPDGPVPSEQRIVEQGAVSLDEFTPQQQ